MPTTKKWLALGTALIIITSALPRLNAEAYDFAAAENYLLAHPSNPWSTMGLSAFGATNISSDYLKTVSGTSAIDYEAPILAITSINQDPRTFGSSNYVDKLKSYFTSGQIGDQTILNDDIFGVLALVSAGLSASDTVIDGSKNFILSHQNNDGGWAYSLGRNSDSNTTASAVIALTSTGVPSSDAHIQNALNFLKTTQNEDGGFTYDPASQFGTASDSSSTAWVIWALNAVNILPSTWSKSGHNPLDYLSSNQASSGYFRFQSSSSEDSFSPVTTAYAAIALTGKTLPLTVISTALPSVNFRIEGVADTVCNGTISAATALDVIKNAAASCNFTYNIKTTSFGPYLNQINTDTAAGVSGWMYLVNYSSPSVGAADYQLQNGDTVLWYFGDFSWLPSRITLSPASSSDGVSQAAASQSVTATIESFTGNSWSPLANATISAGAVTAQSGSDGTASLNLPDGYYKISAQKTGSIRSNTALLKIGQPSSSAVALNANFSGGQVQGTSTQPQLPSTISFTIDAANLDFGSVSAGAQKNKSLNVANSSSANIKLAASVSGDSLFTSNLSVGGSFWQSFAGAVAGGQSQNFSVALNIPANFRSTNGPKNGQLIIWASAE